MNSPKDYPAEYRSWYAAKVRCHNKNSKQYTNYGGRGIRVCKRWRDSFANFFKDMGPKPSPDHSLGRIDNNKGYTRKNCRWETSLEQARNRYNVRYLCFNGEKMTIREWSERLGIKFNTLLQRVQAGWSDEKCLTLSTSRNKKRGPIQSSNRGAKASMYLDAERLMKVRKRSARERRAYEKTDEYKQSRADHLRWFYSEYPDIKVSKKCKNLMEKYPCRTVKPSEES